MALSNIHSPKQLDFQIMMLHIYLSNSNIPQQQFGAYAASYLRTTFTYTTVQIPKILYSDLNFKQSHYTTNAASVPVNLSLLLYA
jgi:hypothetical protein